MNAKLSDEKKARTWTEQRKHKQSFIIEENNNVEMNEHTYTLYIYIVNLVLFFFVLRFFKQLLLAF